MKAMILAAGRGERMRPLTDTLPKPLLTVAGKPLIVWHIERLVQAGINDIVINHAWLGQKIEQTLGNGKQFGAQIQYSAETTALETAGGIARALPYFQQQPFLVINGDIWCDWDASTAPQQVKAMQTSGLLAWLLLVNNPEHHPTGDFVLENNGLLSCITQANQDKSLTFAGIGIYEPTMFDTIPIGQPAALAPLLHSAIARHKVGGALHTGSWTDVGTPQRLYRLNTSLQM